MHFNAHSNLVGRHAFLGASSYHWVNYDEEKLERVWRTSQAAKRGTELHDLAHQMIRLGVKLPQSRKSLNMYVNDAIGYKMVPEQILYYSDNCFGTADAISFRNDILRISDLKTGATPASDMQLCVYAALFCLEYRFRPMELKCIELRIYQNDEVFLTVPDPDLITHIVSKIIAFDKRIEAMKEA